MIEFTLILVILILFLIPVLVSRKFCAPIGFNKPEIDLETVRFSVLLLFLVTTKYLFDKYYLNIEYVDISNSFPRFNHYLMFFTITTLLPFIEEVYFRGVFYSILQKSKLSLVIQSLVSSFFWFLVHLQFEIFTFFHLIFVGISLYMLRHFSQSIWLCVIYHIVMNSLIILLSI
jgi:membrane protease YdiL (CAAX protease family)